MLESNQLHRGKASLCHQYTNALALRLSVEHYVTHHDLLASHSQSLAQVYRVPASGFLMNQIGLFVANPRLYVTQAI